MAKFLVTVDMIIEADNENEDLEYQVSDAIIAGIPYQITYVDKLRQIMM